MALFLITGMSGVGKTYLMDLLKTELIDTYLSECVSHTTRLPREGEIDGRTYHYVSEDVFQNMVDNNKFVEKVLYDGNYYGVSKEEIDDTLLDSEHVYIIVEFGGYKQIKELYPEAIGVFLTASKEFCMTNMLLRGDLIDKATKRIDKYDDEVINKTHYDYVLTNVRNYSDAMSDMIFNIIRMYDKEKGY